MRENIKDNNIYIEIKAPQTGETKLIGSIRENGDVRIIFDKGDPLIINGEAGFHVIKAKGIWEIKAVIERYLKETGRELSLTKKELRGICRKITKGRI